MNKHTRMLLGGSLVLFGLVFFILPGTIFILMFGLTLLSYDIPQARKWLKKCQDLATLSARKLDRFILYKKFR